MKISLIQTSIEWLDAPANRFAAEGWIAQCKGSDLCIFSEMFTTGFCMNPSQSAPSNLETLKWMQKMATSHNIAIGGGIAIEQDGKYLNRFYLVKPSGEVAHYDKRHLFSFAGEQNYYAAGEERVIVEVGGVRILLLICYDLRFPVWSRNRGDYDMIACIANWPKPRRGAWDTLLRARAIENQCYVCGVNIVGKDPNCIYSGGTAAIGFLGETISEVEDEAHGIATLEVDMEALNAFRTKFPALNDADIFQITN